MQLTMMRSKLHRATVTEAILHYEGSISIDSDLLKESGLLVNEQVDVLNINNGERFTTYVIEAPAGSKAIQVNGAGARLAQVGDLVIIVAYAVMGLEEAKNFQPKVLVLGEGNQKLS
jgi:aspartate 1-decarboxylase